MASDKQIAAFTVTSVSIDSARAKQVAHALWTLDFTDSERRLVRFGLFPAPKMERAKAAFKVEGFDNPDMSRLLSVALMEIAEKQGGMIS